MTMAAGLAWPAKLGVIAVAAHLIWQLMTVDLDDAKDCRDKFNSTGSSAGSCSPASSPAGSCNDGSESVHPRPDHPSRPPLVPEIQLHLATEITPIWEATEESLAANGLPPPLTGPSPGRAGRPDAFLLDQPQWVRGKHVLDFAAGSGLSRNRRGFGRRRESRSGGDRCLRRRGHRIECRRQQRRGRGGDGGSGRQAPAGISFLPATSAMKSRWRIGQIAWFRILAGQGVTVLMGDPGRAYLPANGLVEVARYDVPTTKELEDRELRRTVVWRLMP